MLADTWIVSWDTEKHEFPTWSAAREFLLQELEWLAYDLNSERTWTAWEAVIGWEMKYNQFTYSIPAGEPSGTYEITRKGYTG